METDKTSGAERRKKTRYFFDKTVYVKFLKNTEFTMAKYRDISLTGFSCYSYRDIKAGTELMVEVNLKMISNGKIDDTNPHIARAVSLGAIGSDEQNRKIYRFKFTEYSKKCLQNLKKTIAILAQDETGETISSPPDKPPHSVKPQAKGNILNDILKISEGLKSGKIVPPVLPKIVEDVRKIVQQEDKNIERLSDVIEKDAPISARLISISNSSFFKGREKCLSVQKAITRIGVEQTYNTVLAIANKSIYNTQNSQVKMLLENLWKHSLACGFAAQGIAEKVPNTNSNNLFTVGIIHDIGRSVLLKVLGDSISKNEDVNTDEIIAIIREYHSGIAGMILRLWKMPKEFIKAATMHEGYKFPMGTNRYILIINIANQIASQIGYGIDEETVDVSGLESVKLLHLNADILNDVAEDTAQMMALSSLV